MAILQDAPGVRVAANVPWEIDRSATASPACYKVRMRIPAFLLLVCGVAHAAPCVSGTAACTEWVTLNGGLSRSLVYRTYSLDAKNESITRAMVMVHGASRDADNYFRTAVASAFLAGALENTIVVAPRFASKGGGCNDALAENEVNWPCSGDSWRSGGAAAGNPKLTSYDLTDEILRKLADQKVFPNLQQIVLAGHSAGGQFVNRYQMSNLIHEKLRVPVSYVVSNPSSYGYPESVRPRESAYSLAARTPGYVPAGVAAEAFGPFRDGQACTTFDKWPYGMMERSGYSARSSDEQLKKQLVSRPAVYLLGELDILPLGGFDGSCPAMAQGPTRLARGEAFAKYVNEKLGAHHIVTEVHLCGHNGRCMFTSEEALPILFPKPR
jgi:pimeloyl-ACP methyl ester carboxylesterase